jgi:uncharacterized membrane protein
MSTERPDQQERQASVQTSAEEILAEAQRRIEARDQPEVPEAQQAMAETLNRGVYWLSRHWAGVINALILLYVGGTFLAPVLFKIGMPRLGQALHLFYGPFCHQYPFRSWFLFGPQAARPLQEPIPLEAMNELRRVVGNPEIGYKTAFCQRDVAIYGMMGLVGIAYKPLKKRFKMAPLPFWLFFLFGIMPMMLDGGVQWISYALWQFIPGVLAQHFETIPLMRTLTGSLFGAGAVALLYPYLDEYFDEVRTTLEDKYGW